MTWQEMKQIEDEFGRLEASAETAGQHGAPWWSTLLAVNEHLSKLAGRDALDEQLQADVCYEKARAALFAAWSRGEKNPRRAVDIL